MSDDSKSSAASASITEWIEHLKNGSADAALKIWQRYVEQLIQVASARLKNLPRRALDGEDIAQEAFDAFFRGVRENRFSKLWDRHDLWQLLITLVDRRANDHMRRQLSQRRGEGAVRGDSAFEPRTGSDGAGWDNVVGPTVTPESADELIRLIQRSFPELADEQLQRIALDRTANYSVAEIAQRQGITLRTAERKLELIRAILIRSAEDRE